MIKIGTKPSITGYASNATIGAREQTDANNKSRGRPQVKDDFVIPHVGPELTDQDVLSFTQNLAEQIVNQSGKAVAAQANQDRARVTELMK